jgi:hypothetical protein
MGLIGDDFAGVVGSDRFTAYNSLEPERRQVCWSHLRRDFTFHADLGSGPQEAFGLDGLEVTWTVFHAWKQFQQDGDRDALQHRVAAIKAQMRPLLEWGSTGKDSATSGRSRTTCSNCGRRSGLSPTCPTSSRPTTPPSAACARP